MRKEWLLQGTQVKKVMFDEIKELYREVAKEIHPDKNRNNKDAKEAFQSQ